MKLFEGTVVSAKTPKTAYVEVESVWMHPIYRKEQKLTKRYACHDEIGVKEGNKVIIGECRPLSARKHFKIMEVKSK
jgi:small subunit ribosomal protein S17